MSYTLDGTLFTKTVLAAPPAGTNWRVAWIDILDDIDADGRFTITNRVEDVDRLSLFADLVAVTPNSPFETFADVGFGLRVEFRDISP